MARHGDRRRRGVRGSDRRSTGLRAARGLLLVALTAVAAAPARAAQADTTAADAGAPEGERDPVADARSLWKEASAARDDDDFAGFVRLVDEALRALDDASSADADEWRSFLRNSAILVEVDLQRFRSARARIDALLAGLGDPAGDTPRQARARAFAYGQRGEIYRRWGLAGPAAHWFEQEALLVDVLAEEHGTDFVLNEWRASGEHRARLIAMRHEPSSLDALEAFVAERLRDERMEDAAARAKLLRILGIALADASAGDPALADRAAGVLRDVLDQLPPGRAAGRVLPETGLAELAIARGDLEAARRRVADARRHVDASTEAAAGREALVVAEARLALASGAGEPELRARADALASALDDFLERWSAAEPRAGGYGPLHFGHVRSLLVELTRTTVALEGPEAGAEAALALVDRTQVLGRLARGAPPRPPSLAAALRESLHLGPRSGLLLLLPSPRLSLAVALDDAAPTLHELAPIDALQSRIDDALGAWSPPHRTASEEVRAQRLVALADALVPAPLAGRLAGWDALTLAGDDLMLELVFEALPSGDGPAGTRWAVSHLPSLPFARARTPARADQPPRAAWIAAAPPVPASALALAPDLGPVPLERSDARRLLAPYGTAQVLHGGEVTLDALARAPLADAGVLQFFGHGAYDLLSERPATLVVAATDTHDGLLRAADVVEELRPPPVVVLTACRTARGPLRAGDQGAADLAGAFLEAGARAVVTSPYDLDAEAARRLSAVFHRRLARGDTVAEALRASRAALVEDPRFRDPAYHAGLRVVGLGNEALWPAPWWRRTPGGVAGAVTIALAVAVVWATRRRASRRA